MAKAGLAAATVGFGRLDSGFHILYFNILLFKLIQT